MLGQRDVFAELIEEFAVARAETVNGRASHQQHAEHVAALFDEQRHRDERAQAGSPETLGERRIGGDDVRLVDQLAANAAAQAVVVDFDFRLFPQLELGCARCAVRADARHGQLALDLVVLTQAGEIDVQLILETTYHDIEDAGEILALRDRVGSLLQQPQPAELVECLALGELACGRLGAQRGVRGFQIRRPLANPILERLVDPGEHPLRAHAQSGVDRAELREREEQEDTVHESGGMPEHRGTIGRRFRIQHRDVADDGEQRQQHDDQREPLRLADAPIEGAHDDREQRHQRERWPGDSEPGGRLYKEGWDRRSRAIRTR